MVFDVDGGPHFVPLPRVELAALVDVLIGNVFAHTEQGTAFTVEVNPTPDGVRLIISDEGSGFPHTDVVARGKSESGSTGLGLDIARRSTHKAGGRLVLGQAPGGGGVVTATFGRPPG